MKKNVLKKLLCSTLAAVCIVTTVVPVRADDTVTTTEAATRNVTSAYKYHLDGYNYDTEKWKTYSKASFYKDLNSLPSLGMGKNTVHVPEITEDIKPVSTSSDNEADYYSFVKFKAPKTGTYVCTITNLQGTDDYMLGRMSSYGFGKPKKVGKKYNLGSVPCYKVKDYDFLYENNFLTKLRKIIDEAEALYPEYTSLLERDYSDELEFTGWQPTNKIQFTVKLKKGQTYVYSIQTLGAVLVSPYYITRLDKTCMANDIYSYDYSFDMEIKLKTKK